MSRTVYHLSEYDKARYRVAIMSIGLGPLSPEVPLEQPPGTVPVYLSIKAMWDNDIERKKLWIDAKATVTEVRELVEKTARITEILSLGTDGWYVKANA